MPRVETAYIGVGSNVGDRVQNIIDARLSLKSVPFCQSLISSALYWSSPVGYLDQPAFLNCVFELRVAATAHDLFEHLQLIEKQLGRQRDAENRNAPRTIDLDLLVFGTFSCDDPKLVVPHPRIWQRRFVLEPLLELSPELEINGVRVAQRYRLDLAAGCFSGQDVYRLGRPALTAK